MKYIALALLFMSCHPTEKCEHDRIIVKNNSSKTLYFIHGYKGEPPTDTTLGKLYVDPKSGGYITYNDSEFYRLQPNDENVKAMSKQTPSHCFSAIFFGELRNSVEIFFIDSSVISTLSWDTVKKYNLHLKRVFLNGHDLDRLGWKVSYP